MFDGVHAGGHRGFEPRDATAMDEGAQALLACQTDDDLPYVLKYSGEDNIVIGSDYGHNDTSAEIEALRTLKRKGDVDPKVIDKILYDNAKALYGL